MNTPMKIIDFRTKAGREREILNIIRSWGKNGLAYWIFDTVRFRTAFERLKESGQITVTKRAYPYWLIKETR